MGAEPQTTVLYVHKAILSDSSPYFRAALDGSFIEAQGVLKLPEELPDRFASIVKGLYGNKSTNFYPENLPVSTFNPGNLEWHIKFWIQLDMYGLEALATQHMRNLSAKSNPKWAKAMTLELAHFVFSHTMEESPLRRFVVSVITEVMRVRPKRATTDFFSLFADFPEFGAQLVEVFARAAPEKEGFPLGPPVSFYSP